MKNMKNIGFIAVLLIIAVSIAACTSSGSITGAGTNNPPAGTGNAAGTAANNPPADNGQQAPPAANTPPSNPPATNNPPAANTPPDTRVKLADSQFANSAYLISGDTLDSAAQQAISGFNIQKTANQDGTTTIKLTSTNPEYKDQTYTLKSGQMLYFIEKTLGDDGNNQDFNLRDDTAIIVDADGFIVQ